MKHMSCAILLNALFLPGTAQAFTGIDLYKVCADPNGEAVCLAYIRGFAEGYYQGITLGQLAERSRRRLCYPQPPNDNPPDATQVELIVKKYMADNPSELNKEALFIVQDALTTAFRCRQK